MSEERRDAAPTNDPVSEFQALAARVFDERVAKYHPAFKNRADAVEALCRVMAGVLPDFEATTTWQAGSMPDRYEFGGPHDQTGREVVAILAGMLMPLAEIAHLCKVPFAAVVEHAAQEYRQMLEEAGTCGH